MNYKKSYIDSLYFFILYYILKAWWAYNVKKNIFLWKQEYIQQTDVGYGKEAIAESI